MATRLSYVRNKTSKGNYDIVQGEFINDFSISAGAKELQLVLLHLARGGVNFFPTYDNIKRYYQKHGGDVSRQSLTKYFKELEKAGYLERKVTCIANRKQIAKDVLVLVYEVQKDEWQGKDNSDFTQEEINCNE